MINLNLKSFEYQYLNIKKRVFVEQFLDNEIINYKFSCFNGSPKLVRVKAKINGTNYYNIYFLNWTTSHIELENKKYYISNRFKKPINYQKMIRYAQLLSSGFSYCRVGDRCRKDKKKMFRRFLDNLQQRIECSDGKHVHLINDVDTLSDLGG